MNATRFEHTHKVRIEALQAWPDGRVLLVVVLHLAKDRLPNVSETTKPKRNQQQRRRLFVLTKYGFWRACCAVSLLEGLN